MQFEIEHILKSLKFSQDLNTFRSEHIFKFPFFQNLNIFNLNIFKILYFIFEQFFIF
jgi:hypothetical protein